MSEEQKIDPRHHTTRTVLRTLGPPLAVLGLLLIAVGVVSFFSAFGTFEPPRYFWCVFLGIPVLFVGVVLCLMGFLGSFARYVSGEAAPVQKDTFNYLAEGTKGGVKTFAQAVGEGLAAGMGGEGKTKARCPRCEHANDADAKFCNKCGTPLGGS
jgi:hypothetical protein